MSFKVTTTSGTLEGTFPDERSAVAHALKMSHELGERYIVWNPQDEAIGDYYSPARPRKTTAKRAGKRRRAYSGGAKKRSAAPARSFSRMRARRGSTAKRSSSIAQAIEYFRKDGYNDGRFNADLRPSDYEGRTPAQVAKSMRREAMDPNVLKASGYWETALEHSEGDKAGARRLLRAYLDDFEAGIKQQIKDIEERRASDRQMGYED
jgi:hypothetical protein